MVHRFIIALFFALLAQRAAGQMTYRLEPTLPVEVNENTITMPWAGGFNSAQFNTMDLNGDGKQDLVIFERTANKVLTFINIADSYAYDPSFESLFPVELDQWLLLRDFNCDGKKDIFTHTNFGIAVFVNVTTPGQPLRWRPFNPGFPLLTQGYSFPINLQVNGTDIPAIDDIDGDGDLDILDAVFASQFGTIEWHKNMSIERTGRCDSMQLVRKTNAWGNFEECNCAEYLFGGETSCDVFNGGRTLHAAGKSLLTIDTDNDGDRDLLFSEESCNTIYFMKNNGTRDSANMTGFTTFPSSHPVVDLQLFPAAYYEDVDFDGIPDLVVSTNVYTRNLITINFKQSAWFYKNSGTVSSPQLTFVKNNFLQDQMIDVGDNSTPAFADEDGDGDLDMFIGSFTSENILANLFFYENTGTATEPSFKYITDNYANLPGYGFYNMKPQFADMNADGMIDLVFSGTDTQTGVTSVYYVPNTSASSIKIMNVAPKRTPFDLNFDDNATVVDVNQDGLPDLLVGTATGAVEYWMNTGPRGSLNFTRQTKSFMGLGISTQRQNPAIATGDLDADGKADLVLGDQRGILTIYSDFRNAGESPVPDTAILWDAGAQKYKDINLGGHVWPVITNLHSTDRPLIAVGNLLGGIQILRNDGSSELPAEPVISVYPNPTDTEKVFYIKTDRDMSAAIFSVLGQKVSEEHVVTGYEPLRINAMNLTSGVYIIRLTLNSKTYARRILIK